VDTYPVEILKRVDRPTTLINDDDIQRLDEREHGFNRAARGDFGPSLKKERPRMPVKHPLSASLVSACGHLSKILQDRITTQRAPQTDDPVMMARHIKETAYFLRADIVGICHLPPYAVYSHNTAGEPVELNHKYAIAIVIDQDYKTANATVGNDWISSSMSYLAYSTSGFVAQILADYIRRLGYPAKAHHARNYDVVVPPILLWAGIGEMCRIGDIVLSPFLGPRFKAAIVTTDLPLEVDKPIDFGLQDFCAKCMQCARYCPSGSIPFDEKITHNGYEKWHNDVEKCTKERVGNKMGASCGVCISVCPWNKPYTPFHRFIQWTMRKIPFARKYAVMGDELLGYDQPKLKDKWWFDFEDIEGKLHLSQFSGLRGDHKKK
jgi:reductive dehalogenase